MFLGLLSVVQAIWAPGYLALRLGRVKTSSKVETGVLSLALSLLINYFYVLTLTLLGVYGRAAVFMLIGLESVLGAWFLFRKRDGENRKILVPRLPAFRQGAWYSTSAVVLSLLALLGYLGFTLKAVLRFNVFNAWDAIFSWNHWANTWYTGVVPVHTSLYPQLMPANWSMMYLVSGSPELQLFALGIMPIFSAAILLMFWDLGLRKKRLGYFLALLLCGAAFFFLRKAAPLASGYMAMPTAFMSAVPLYLLAARPNVFPQSWRELSLPVIVACAASVTKLNGAYALFMVIVVGLIGHWNRRYALTPRDWMKSAVFTGSVVVLVPGVWYGMKVLDFIRGRDVPNLAELSHATKVAAGSGGATAQLIHAAGLFPGGLVGLGLFAAILLLSLFIPRVRWMTIGVLVPYTLLWGVIASYDIRNWLVVVPLAAYVGAMTLRGLAERLWHVRPQLRTTQARWWPSVRRPLELCASAGLVGIVGFSLAIPAPAVVARELQLQRSIGSPTINRALYRAVSRDPSIQGTFLTGYRYFEKLPRFRSNKIRAEHTSRIHTVYKHPSEITTADLEGKDYLLISSEVPDTVQAAIDRRIADGSYSLIFEVDAGDPGMAYEHRVKVRLVRVNP